MKKMKRKKKAIRKKVEGEGEAAAGREAARRSKKEQE